MSMSQDPIFESALALPQSERADLAFLLLESLDPPGKELSANEFGDELRRRVAEHRSGRDDGLSLEDVRAEMARRLSEGHRS